MARVGNSIIKDIEVQEVINLLNRAYADEWLAYYQYFIEGKVVKGIMKDAAITELNQHAADELRHANLWLQTESCSLEEHPLLHPEDWMKYTNCGYDAPKKFRRRCNIGRCHQR